MAAITKPYFVSKKKFKWIWKKNEEGQKKDELNYKK